jgi:hypothetical protein
MASSPPSIALAFWKSIVAQPSECAACLDVLVTRKLVGPEQIIPAKEQLVRIVNMLMGMLKRFSARAEFLREDEGLYAIDQEHEHEQEENRST